MAATVPERVVEHGAVAQLAQVHHEVAVGSIGPVVFDETASVARPRSVQQRDQRITIGVFGQVQLVVGLERLDAVDEPVIVGRQLDEVRHDRRVGDELRAERVGPQRKHPRRVDTVRRADVERRVRAVQCHPAPTALDPAADALLGADARTHVAGVADQNRTRRDAVGVLVVGLHADTELLVLTEQREQLATSEVDVVVHAPSDEGDVDPTHVVQ